MDAQNDTLHPRACVCYTQTHSAIVAKAFGSPQHALKCTFYSIRTGKQASNRHSAPLCVRVGQRARGRHHFVLYFFVCGATWAEASRKFPYFMMTHFVSLSVVRGRVRCYLSERPMEER